MQSQLRKTFNAILIVLFRSFFTLNLCAFIRLFIVCNTFHYSRDAILGTNIFIEEKCIFFWNYNRKFLWHSTGHGWSKFLLCISCDEIEEQHNIKDNRNFYYLLLANTQIKKHLVYKLVWYMFLFDYSMKFDCR